MGELLPSSIGDEFRERIKRMANISEPSGTFHLAGEWTPEMIKTFNIIKKEWEEFWYNTTIEEEFENSGDTLKFWGQGRWAYSYNLINLGGTTEVSDKDEIRNAYAALCLEMESNNARIVVEYFDRESGCQVLYEATAELFGQNGKLVCVETNYVEYDYNDENLDKLGYMEDDFDDGSEDEGSENDSMAS